MLETARYEDQFEKFLMDDWWSKHCLGLLEEAFCLLQSEFFVLQGLLDIVDRVTRGGGS